MYILLKHYIDIYLDLRKDTNFYPFARFLPLGRISFEGPGNGRFLTSVVNFVFRTFWADNEVMVGIALVNSITQQMPPNPRRKLHKDHPTGMYSNRFFCYYFLNMFFLFFPVFLHVFPFVPSCCLEIDFKDLS